MKISKAIEFYRKSISESISNMAPFTMIRCGVDCGCVAGIKFGNITLDGQRLCAGSHKFKLSVDLANKLEEEFLPVIQPERLNQTWENRNGNEVFMG